MIRKKQEVAIGSPEQSTSNTLFYIKKIQKTVFYVNNTSAMTILKTKRCKERYKTCI